MVWLHETTFTFCILSFIDKLRKLWYIHLMSSFICPTKITFFSSDQTSTFACWVMYFVHYLWARPWKCCRLLLVFDSSKYGKKNKTWDVKYDWARISNISDVLLAKPQWFRAIGFLRGTAGSCRLGLGVMAMREVTVCSKTTMAALKQLHVASVISELERESLIYQLAPLVALVYFLLWLTDLIG